MCAKSKCVVKIVKVVNKCVDMQNKIIESDF